MKHFTLKGEGCIAKWKIINQELQPDGNEDSPYAAPSREDDNGQIKWTYY